MIGIPVRKITPNGKTKAFKFEPCILHWNNCFIIWFMLTQGLLGIQLPVYSLVLNTQSYIQGADF